MTATIIGPTNIITSSGANSLAVIIRPDLSASNVTFIFLCSWFSLFYIISWCIMLLINKRMSNNTIK